jgi:hypothetical protein
MKPKTTLILALILVVLAGIATLFQTSKKKSLSPQGKPIFPAFAQAKTDGIDIRGKGRTVQLRKRGNTWVVATEGWHEADTRAPKDLLDAVEKSFDSSSLISTARDKQAAFEVDSTGISVNLLQGSKSLAEFVVGKPGPDFMSTYVRPVKEDKVYLIPSYLRSMVDRGKETWRKTLLVDLDPANIVGLTARSPKQTIALEKDAGGAWKITQPFASPAKAEIVSYLMRTAGHIRASSFADSTLDPATLGLVPDTTRVEVKSSDGSTTALVVGKLSERNQCYVRKDGDPAIYLVPRGSINTIFRDPNSLKAEGAPAGEKIPAAPAPAVAPAKGPAK